MPNTQQDLIIAALGELNAVGVGETPSAEDVATVRAYVDPRIAKLGADRVYYLPDVEDIPDEAFIPLSILIANAAAPKFGQPRSQETEAIQESELRRLGGMVKSRPARIEYF